MTNIKTRYSERYSAQDAQHIYPVEFVVRAFLGTYPELKMDRRRYSASNVLDLGFGDGRNMPLLKNLGFVIYGVEIDENITRAADDRLSRIGIDADLRVGANSRIPFENHFFDAKNAIGHSTKLNGTSSRLAARIVQFTIKGT